MTIQFYVICLFFYIMLTRLRPSPLLCVLCSCDVVCFYPPPRVSALLENPAYTPWRIWFNAWKNLCRYVSRIISRYKCCLTHWLVLWNLSVKKCSIAEQTSLSLFPFGFHISYNTGLVMTIQFYVICLFFYIMLTRLRPSPLLCVLCSCDVICFYPPPLVSALLENPAYTPWRIRFNAWKNRCRYVSRIISRYMLFNPLIGSLESFS
jgi:hypothetical protein